MMLPTVQTIINIQLVEITNLSVFFDLDDERGMCLL